MPDERDHVHEKSAFRRTHEFTERAGLLRVEQTAAHFVLEPAVRRHSERRKTAVARHLGGDALPHERFVILFRVVVVVKEIVVGVRVDEPRRHRQPRAIHGFVRLHVEVCSDRRNTLPVDEDVAFEPRRARTVDNVTAFEQNFHNFPLLRHSRTRAVRISARRTNIKIILTLPRRKINRVFAHSAHIKRPREFSHRADGAPYVPQMSFCALDRTVRMH